ncbi:putative O-antigen transporter [Arcobacter porcinus]|uniref:flippase n=1 Tax=Arcobacter porcinus TaxID=1935204 RepID=UPI0008245FED|nr:flippase [Arcobacter porcinus]OCL85175.1 putative O-antigen transporter [Arcobacter porcinus]
MIKRINKIANTEDKKRLLSNFFSLSVLQIFSYILPLITLPYLVRVLGVETFGLISFATAFIIFFNILVDYGFNLSATREVSVHRENKDKITEIYSSVLIIKFILTIFSFFILSFIVFIFDKFNSHFELYFITFLSVIGQAFFPIWYFQGMEKMKYITIINISSKFLFTIAIFLFVHKEGDYLLVPLLNGLGIIIGSLYSLYIIKKDFKQKFSFQTIEKIKKYFIDSTQFFLSRVSAVLYTSANVFILGLFTNNTMVGYYAIAEKVYQAMTGIYSPLNQILYPYIAKSRNINLFKKVFYSSISLNIIGVVILYVFGEYIFSFLFTQEIGIETIKVFNILLITILIVVPSILFGYPLLGALGYVKDANYSVVLASIFYIIGIIILIFFNSINIYTIAIMVFVPEFIVFFYRFLKVRKYNIWSR